MAYLLWGLLNIGLFLYFIGICFKATKLIREKIGGIAAVIFVLGLLSFMGKSNNENVEPNTQNSKTWIFETQDSLHANWRELVSVDLEDHLVLKIGMHISYTKEKAHEIFIPLNATTWVTGLQSGTSWKPMSIIVQRTNNNHQFSYEVDGIVNWSLLGLHIYSQPKHWEGLVKVE